MMLSFQVRQMQRAINRLVSLNRPPESVMILQDHAEYLGVKPLPRDPVADVVDRSNIPAGKPVPNLCKVRLVELFVALKNAKGVDEEGLIQVPEEE